VSMICTNNSGHWMFQISGGQSLHAHLFRLPISRC